MKKNNIKNKDKEKKKINKVVNTINDRKVIVLYSENKLRIEDALVDYFVEVE